jgi:CRP/FNR family transcriptional regulator
VTPSAESILRATRLFRAVDPVSLGKLAAIARVVRFGRGTTVFLEGDPCPGVYAVGTGAVKVYKLAPGGKEHLLHWAEPGMSFAEVAAIGGFDCPACAEAADDTVCALLPGDAFRGLIESDARLCFAVMRGMAGWVRYLVGLLEDIVLRDAAGRLARHLIGHADAGGSVSLGMLKKDLASHLNLTSETLSRTLRRLVEQGAIDVADGKEIRIRDAELLRSVAEGSAGDE